MKEYTDRRLKTDIEELEIKGSLKPVRCTARHGGRAELCLIAQDVEEFYPELISVDTLNGFKQLDYAGIVVVLTAELNSAKARVNVLENEVTDLRSQVTLFGNELITLQRLIEQLTKTNASIPSE